MKSLTHINERGEALMVDISDKADTQRKAVAAGRINMSSEALAAVYDQTAPKGDVLAAARIAGIMAVKKTPELIPLCHILELSRVTVDFAKSDDGSGIDCVCEVSLTGKTGAEMEALTGVSVALLTIYDMCKAIDKAMEITDIRLLSKSGGKSGDYVRSDV